MWMHITWSIPHPHNKPQIDDFETSHLIHFRTWISVRPYVSRMTLLRDVASTNILLLPCVNHRTGRFRYAITVATSYHPFSLLMYNGLFLQSSWALSAHSRSCRVLQFPTRKMSTTYLGTALQSRAQLKSHRTTQDLYCSPT